MPLVVRPDERRPLDARLNGVKIQQLFRVETVLESLLSSLNPVQQAVRATSMMEKNFEGTLEIFLDETERFDLEEGDSMTFASHRPDRLANKGAKPSSILWINTPPTF